MTHSEAVLAGWVLLAVAVAVIAALALARRR